MSLPFVVLSSCWTDIRPCRVDGAEGGLRWAGVSVLVLISLMPVSQVWAQDLGTGVRVDVQPPAIRGAIRYGRWAPLDVVIRQPGGTNGFSGTLEITGTNGFTTRHAVELSAGLDRYQQTIPVFCSSRLPVFRVTLLNKSGQEVGRDQQRYSSVLDPEEVVVGVSLDYSDSSIDGLREKLSDRIRAPVRVIAAERRALMRTGRWPGIFDLLYLTESAEVSVPVRTDLSDTAPFPGGVDLLPNVQLVDQAAYDLFNPPKMSDRRRRWFESSLTLLSLVLIVGVLFCFRDPTSRWNWLVLIVLPGLVLGYLATNEPPSPPVIGQVVSARVSDSSFRTHVIDRRVSLFPRTKPENNDFSNPKSSSNGSRSSPDHRSVRYPLRDLRRTIPLFHSRSAISSRFPQLEQTESGYVFQWPEFPIGGYFVLQELTPRSSDDRLLTVEGNNEQRQIAVRNRGAQDLHTVWIKHKNSFYRIGELAAGDVRIVEPGERERVGTRERFLGRAFSVDSPQQRLLSRWMKYILQRYDRNKPFVVGVQRPNGKGMDVQPESFDLHQFPRVVLHRFDPSRNK